MVAGAGGSCSLHVCIQEAEKLMLSLNSFPSFYLAHRDGVHMEEIGSCSRYGEGLCPCYTMAVKWSPHPKVEC